jgi:hypothetical protein
VSHQLITLLLQAAVVVVSDTAVAAAQAVYLQVVECQSHQVHHILLQLAAVVQA